MSETEKFVGKIQLRPRLENETDKDYFERVTGCNWQKYDYEPDSITEAIYDNNLSYYEAKRGQKGYICLEYINGKLKGTKARDFYKEYAQTRSLYEHGYKVIGNIYENKDLLNA